MKNVHHQQGCYEVSDTEARGRLYARDLGSKITKTMMSIVLSFVLVFTLLIGCAPAFSFMNSPGSPLAQPPSSHSGV